MKRIVDGRTYNTETSTLVARAEWEADTYSPYAGSEVEGELYQTRGGAFFLVTTIHIPEGPDSEARDKTECDAMTAAQAQAWLLEGDVEVIRNVFDEPPEAEAEEADTGATIYIRVPASLKREVDAAAEEAGTSGNVWAMRCVERCLGSRGVREKLAVAYHALILGRANDGDGLSAAQSGELLNEAIGHIEGLWGEFGFGNIADAALSREVEELTRRYPLYENEPQSNQATPRLEQITTLPRHRKK